MHFVYTCVIFQCQDYILKKLICNWILRRKKKQCTNKNGTFIKFHSAKLHLATSEAMKMCWKLNVKSSVVMRKKKLRVFFSNGISNKKAVWIVQKYKKKLIMKCCVVVVTADVRKWRLWQKCMAWERWATAMQVEVHSITFFVQRWTCVFLFATDPKWQSDKFHAGHNLHRCCCQLRNVWRKKKKYVAVFLCQSLWQRTIDAHLNSTTKHATDGTTIELQTRENCFLFHRWTWHMHWMRGPISLSAHNGWTEIFCNRMQSM